MDPGEISRLAPLPRNDVVGRTFTRPRTFPRCMLTPVRFLRAKKRVLFLSRNDVVEMVLRGNKGDFPGGNGAIVSVRFFWVSILL